MADALSFLTKMYSQNPKTEDTNTPLLYSKSRRASGK
jgi:hypothetical protein